MDVRHESAIKHTDEMFFIKEHSKHLRPMESKRYWSAVRKSLEIDIKTLCEVCKGTGKISWQFYEDLQKGCRR